MNCLLCKGDLEKKQTTFMVDLGNCIVIVKNVPSDVCRQCGEVYYSDDVMGQLERIVNALKTSLTEVAIVSYPGKVA